MPAPDPGRRLAVDGGVSQNEAGVGNRHSFGATSRGGTSCGSARIDPAAVDLSESHPAKRCAQLSHRSHHARRAEASRRGAFIERDTGQGARLDAYDDDGDGEGISQGKCDLERLRIRQSAAKNGNGAPRRPDRGSDLHPREDVDASLCEARDECPSSRRESILAPPTGRRLQN
jgi:hypothetical protein